MARSSAGSESTTSVKRMSNVSTGTAMRVRPRASTIVPANAATEPTRVPTSVATRFAPMPTVSDVRAPCSSRLQ